MNSDQIRREFQEISALICEGVNTFVKKEPLLLECSFEIGHKTISEIGGRFLEEYILMALKTSFQDHPKYQIGSLSSRSLGDFLIRSKGENPNTIYFDVKTQHISIRQRTLEYYTKNKIEQKKPGESHPNLISYQKAIDFFSDRKKSKDDIGMVFIKYDPTIIDGKVAFNILELESESIVLLRDLSDKNLSFGNLGKGQVQLSRVNNIELIQREKIDFLKFIDDLKNRPRKLRNSPKI